MRILILGSGAREHAIAWKISAEIGKQNVFVAPGNGGTELCGTNVDIGYTSFADLRKYCIANAIARRPKLVVAIIAVKPVDVRTRLSFEWLRHWLWRKHCLRSAWHPHVLMLDTRQRRHCLRQCEYCWWRGSRRSGHERQNRHSTCRGSRRS